MTNIENRRKFLKLFVPQKSSEPKGDEVPEMIVEKLQDARLVAYFTGIGTLVAIQDIRLKSMDEINELLARERETRGIVIDNKGRHLVSLLTTRALLKAAPKGIIAGLVGVGIVDRSYRAIKDGSERRDVKEMVVKMAAGGGAVALATVTGDLLFSYEKPTPLKKMAIGMAVGAFVSGYLYVNESHKSTSEEKGA